MSVDSWTLKIKRNRVYDLGLWIRSYEDVQYFWFDHFVDHDSGFYTSSPFSPEQFTLEWT